MKISDECRSLRLTVSFLIPFTLLVGCTTSQHKNPQQNLNQISFLLGCWQNVEGKKVRSENWKKISESHFSAKGSEYQGKKRIFWETLSIQVVDNQIVYSPKPFGKASVDFKYSNQSDSFKKAALFFNREHDFPQTIFYSSELKSPHKIYVDVRGLDKNNQSTGFTYTLKKTICENK